MSLFVLNCQIIIASISTLLSHPSSFSFILLLLLSSSADYTIYNCLLLASFSLSLSLFMHPFCCWLFRVLWASGPWGQSETRALSRAWIWHGMPITFSLCNNTWLTCDILWIFWCSDAIIRQSQRQACLLFFFFPYSFNDFPSFYSFSHVVQIQRCIEQCSKKKKVVVYYFLFTFLHEKVEHFNKCSFGNSVKNNLTIIIIIISYIKIEKCLIENKLDKNFHAMKMSLRQYFNSITHCYIIKKVKNTRQLNVISLEYPSIVFLIDVGKPIVDEFFSRPNLCILSK